MMSRIFFTIMITCLLSWHINHAQQHPPTEKKLIKIGLLIDKNESISAKNAAELAINLANKNQDNSTHHFQVLVRSMEGPWGTGSKEAVNMVFDEDVWAILGSHDSRNAHLAEQVIAKTGVVLLSAWATDPSLAQAFIPWYFSCVPNDNQQATALMDEVSKNYNLKKILLASDRNHDSKLALRSLQKVIKNTSKLDAKELIYDGSASYFERVRKTMNEGQMQGIIISGSNSFSFNLIEKLRNSGFNQPVFATLSMLGEGEFQLDQLLQYQNITVVTSGNWLQSDEPSFQNKYEKKYGEKPNASAAYAFDGMNLLIQAIKKAEFERVNLHKTMAKIRLEGVTGSIHFDKNGNRMEPVGLIKIKNGNLKPIEK